MIFVHIIAPVISGCALYLLA
ncbi:type I toxin-antitoxin system Fst family toxin [Staphylococcus xylosus]|nr:type I toxin-antitoxin system Fst family toxin [Staphylococcus xylosus]